jgi:hypothetical protein
MTRHDAAVAAALAAAPPVGAELARDMRALLLPYAVAARTHHCHLERRPADHGTAARARCACGWVGRWYITGARAVEQGITHCNTESRGGKPE